MQGVYNGIDMGPYYPGVWGIVTTNRLFVFTPRGRHWLSPRRPPTSAVRGVGVRTRPRECLPAYPDPWDWCAACAPLPFITLRRIKPVRRWVSGVRPQSEWSSNRRSIPRHRRAASIDSGRRDRTPHCGAAAWRCPGELLEEAECSRRSSQPRSTPVGRGKFFDRHEIQARSGVDGPVRGDGSRSGATRTSGIAVLQRFSANRRACVASVSPERISSPSRIVTPNGVTRQRLAPDPAPRPFGFHGHPLPWRVATNARPRQVCSMVSCAGRPSALGKVGPSIARMVVGGSLSRGRVGRRLVRYRR